MRDIKVNTIYKHFKGGEYVVLGESIPQSRFCGSMLFEGVEHTETGGLLNVFEYDCQFMHWKNTYTERLVICLALYGDYRLYATPFDVFASEVDKEKYPSCEQKYKFEEVFNIPYGFTKA